MYITSSLQTNLHQMRDFPHYLFATCWGAFHHWHFDHLLYRLPAAKGHQIHTMIYQRWFTLATHVNMKDLKLGFKKLTWPVNDKNHANVTFAKTRDCTFCKNLFRLLLQSFHVTPLKCEKNHQLDENHTKEPSQTRNWLNSHHLKLISCTSCFLVNITSICKVL